MPSNSQIITNKIYIMDTATGEKNVLIKKKFPESIAKILLSSKLEELKEMIVTENGFTIAEEERILKAEKENREEESKVMTNDKFIKDLKNRL